jgi:acyl carrier protein
MMKDSFTDLSIESASQLSVPANSPSVNDICEWLTGYLAKTLRIECDEIDLETKFDTYSMDSLVLVVMTEDLGEWMGKPIDPTVPFEHPTIQSLAEYLAS